MPFAVCGTGIKWNKMKAFNEKEIGKSPVVIEKGYTILESFLNNAC